MCIGLLEFLLPFFFSSQQHYCLSGICRPFSFLFFQYISLSSLSSRCCCIYHFIHKREGPSLDWKLGEDKGTTTITTYMTFLFCLVQIHLHLRLQLLSFFPLLFFLSHITAVYTHGKSRAIIHIEPQHIIASRFHIVTRNVAVLVVQICRQLNRQVDLRCVGSA
jgi:hypothetical protein